MWKNFGTDYSLIAGQPWYIIYLVEYSMEYSMFDVNLKTLRTVPYLGTSLFCELIY